MNPPQTPPPKVDLDLDLDFDLPPAPAPAADETRVLPPGALQPQAQLQPQPKVVYEDVDATRAMPSTQPTVMPAPVAPAAKAPPAQPIPTPAPATAPAALSDETIVRAIAHNASPSADDTILHRPAPARGVSDETIVRPGGLAAPAPSPAPPSQQPTTLGSTLSSTISGLGRSLPGTSGEKDGVLRQVGRYEVRSRLGRGGMATVYRAHDPNIGRDIAIKFLHASLAEDEECRTRFLREARAAGSLSHPHIAAVHDVGEIEGRPFMAMELLEGRSLADILDTTPQLPIRDVMMLGLQLAQALEYAHNKGIVHRDIKPGNIMLLADKSGIKVTDFGIAHIEGSGAHAPTLVGAVLGTPQYMSPEQTRGDKLDGRSDLFSAGIVLYQAATGERPFKGDNLVAVAQQIATAEPPPINARRPDMPPALRRVIERCLAKQPAQRFASGAELAQALRKVIAEHDAAQAEKSKPRIVPLRLKWALIMAAVVATAMAITGALITQRLNAALLAQASEYGGALTRFIAQQNAAAVLGEEWDVVDIAVQETMNSRHFERIVVLDKTGVVRSSTVTGQAGQAWLPPASEALGSVAGGVQMTRFAGGAGPVLGFEAPITYRDQQVGRVVLGLPEAPLAAVARLSITLMIVLVVVTVIVAALVMLVLAKGVARPIALVSEGMGELARGRFSHRIDERRSDEFGELFGAFDRMAAALQRRDEEAAAPAPPTPPHQP
jgi:eukaryotic-like serine/threonine-protein kinase